MQWVSVLTLIVLFLTLLGVLYYAKQARQFRPIVVMEFREGDHLPFIRNIGPGPAFNIEVGNITNPRNTWTGQFRRERNTMLESGGEIQAHPGVTRPGTTEAAIQPGMIWQLLTYGIDRVNDPDPVVLLPVSITFDDVAGTHYVTEQEIEYHDIGRRTRMKLMSSGRS